MQRGRSHHLQDAARAGGRRAVSPHALDPADITEEPGQHGAEEQETHVCAAAERVSHNNLHTKVLLTPLMHQCKIHVHMRMCKMMCKGFYLGFNLFV